MILIKLGGSIITNKEKVSSPLEANFEKTITNLQSRNYDCFSVKIDSKGLDTF